MAWSYYPKFVNTEKIEKNPFRVKLVLKSDWFNYRGFIKRRPLYSLANMRNAFTTQPGRYVDHKIGVGNILRYIWCKDTTRIVDILQQSPLNVYNKFLPTNHIKLVFAKAKSPT